MQEWAPSHSSQFNLHAAISKSITRVTIHSKHGAYLASVHLVLSMK